MTGSADISVTAARRIALAAQGFNRPRPNSANDVRHFRRALASIAVLQLDFVNVLVPAHFLMIWSRLGAYDRGHFERYLYESGEYIEQWAHEASVVASRDWRLLAHRRDAFQQSRNNPLKKLATHKAYLNNILRQVTAQGETTASDLPTVRGPDKKAGEWHRSIPRQAIEHHFGTGKLAVRRRRRNFQRVYDLPDRILAAEHLKKPMDPLAAQRELLRTACSSLGIGTLKDIADYYRMNTRDVAPRVQELVEEGSIREVSVDGWQELAYLAANAVVPRTIPGASLLSPFDPLVWFRPRALRLFDFDYRIEIYVPEARRRWGYYVLPFRLGDSIVARVDLKADRQASVLRVQHAHCEAAGGKAAESLALELRDLASWLQLDTIAVNQANAFEKALAKLTRA